MLKIHQIQIILSIALLLPGQACPDSIFISTALSSETCLYSYSVVNGNCSFLECRNKMSSSSPVELMGWNECFSECCSGVTGNLPATGDSIELLYACQSANAARSTKFIGMLAGCFGGLAVISLVGVICYVKQSCPLNRWIGKTAEDRYANNQYKDPFDEQKPVARVAENLTSAQLAEDIKEITLADFRTGTEVSPAKSYHSSGAKNIALLTAKCLVCMQQRPNCELCCNHTLHHRCLGLWFQRHTPAPCGDINVKIVRVYCSYCLALLGAKEIHKFKSMFKAGDESFHCTNCKGMSPKIRNTLFLYKR